MIRVTKIALFLVVELSACIAAASAAPIIGIVEETAKDDLAKTIRADVRLGFIKTDKGWTAIACDAVPTARAPEWRGLSMKCDNITGADTPMVWTVTYRGNKLGEITTQGWLDTSYYFCAGALRIASGKAPFVGERDKIYSGWTNASVHHPLVAISPATPVPLSRWSEDKPHPELLGAIRPQFERLIPEIEVCLARKHDDSLYVPRAPRISDLEALSGWRSSAGEMLLHVQVNSKFRRDCDGPAGMQSELWFYRDARAVVRSSRSICRSEIGQPVGRNDPGRFQRLRRRRQ